VRDREFADSLLEGTGFELPVPRAIQAEDFKVSAGSAIWRITAAATAEQAFASNDRSPPASDHPKTTSDLTDFDQRTAAIQQGAEKI
jgi:hypothetical protein